MPRHYRIHAIAIAAIVALISVVYFVLRPPPPVPAAAEIIGDRFVQIYSATWGESCNPYIDSTNTTAPVKRDANGVVIDSKPLSHVTRDNVLDTLSELCNQKLACTVPANSATLKLEPLDTCFKHLKVSYRCYSYDRLWNLDVTQGDSLKIDCHDGAAQPKQ